MPEEKVSFAKGFSIEVESTKENKMEFLNYKNSKAILWYITGTCSRLEDYLNEEVLHENYQAKAITHGYGITYKNKHLQFKENLRNKDKSIIVEFNRKKTFEIYLENDKWFIRKTVGNEVNELGELTFGKLDDVFEDFIIQFT